MRDMQLCAVEDCEERPLPHDAFCARHRNIIDGTPDHYSADLDQHGHKMPCGCPWCARELGVTFPRGWSGWICPTHKAQVLAKFRAGVALELVAARAEGGTA